MNSENDASSVPVPARKRGSIRLARFDARPAPITIPAENGRNAKPALSGL